MSLSSILYWPTFLPLPSIDASGSPLHITAASSVEEARIQRRQRYKAVVVRLDVTWTLNVGEYDNFKDFFTTDLGNGAAKFIIALRYPKATELTEWRVQFLDSYVMTYEDYNWVIEASLTLHEIIPAVAPEPALPTGWGGFQVVSEQESDGSWDTFTEADGFVFYTRI